MNNEARRQSLLALWCDIAEDKSLQVHLRLKASEYAAKALGLIGDTPGVAIIQEKDEATKQLEALTFAQLEKIAQSTTAEIMNAQEALCAPADVKNDKTPTSHTQQPTEATLGTNNGIMASGVVK